MPNLALGAAAPIAATGSPPGTIAPMALSSVLDLARCGGHAWRLGMETTLTIAGAIIGLLLILFMFGAAKVSAEADRQSEILARLLMGGRPPEPHR